MEISQDKRLDKTPKYLAMGIAAVLVTALVLAQPTMQTSYSQVVNEGAPEFFDCKFNTDDQAEDPLAMNTIRNKDVAKTIIAEKEIFRCETVQGDIPVIIDVTTIAEIFENMTTKSIISKQAHVITCAKLDVKDIEETTLTTTSTFTTTSLSTFLTLVVVTVTVTGTTTITSTSTTTAPAGDGSALGCDTYTPDADFVPVSGCDDDPKTITHPQEMNTVNKGNTVKTIIAQKEIFYCTFGTGDFPNTNPDDDDKKVEQYLIEEIWENLSLLPGDTVVKKNVESLRCVILATDAFVESCQFTSLQVQELED